MEQFEKVRKGLECCDRPNDHAHCPYDGENHYNICTDKLLKDAIALIRQQQARIAELEAEHEAKVITAHGERNVSRCCECRRQRRSPCFASVV